MQGKVAAILNSREIAITLGATDGVTEGMVFRILEEAKEVRHPETQEVIGVVRREKIRVRVTEVQAKMAVARTFETYQVNVGGSGLSFGVFGGPPPKWDKRTRTLKYEDTGIDFEPLSEENALVKLGDTIELVSEPIDPPVES